MQVQHPQRPECRLRAGHGENRAQGRGDETEDRYPLRAQHLQDVGEAAPDVRDADLRADAEGGEGIPGAAAAQRGDAEDHVRRVQVEHVDEVAQRRGAAPGVGHALRPSRAARGERQGEQGVRIPGGGPARRAGDRAGIELDDRNAFRNEAAVDRLVGPYDQDLGSGLEPDRLLPLPGMAGVDGGQSPLGQGAGEHHDRAGDAVVDQRGHHGPRRRLVQQPTREAMHPVHQLRIGQATGAVVEDDAARPTDGGLLDGLRAALLQKRGSLGVIGDICGTVEVEGRRRPVDPKQAVRIVRFFHAATCPNRPDLSRRSPDRSSSRGRGERFRRRP